MLFGRWLKRKFLYFKSHSTRVRRLPWFVGFWFFLSLVSLVAIGVSLVYGASILLSRVPKLRLVWDKAEKFAPLYQEAKNPQTFVKVIATAYSSDVDQTDNSPCLTATGFDVCANYVLYGAANTVAANFLPPHTIIKIPELYGDKLFVVRDRMNDRFYKRIDLWMPTRAQAVRFGVKYLKVEVYGPD